MTKTGRFECSLPSHGALGTARPTFPDLADRFLTVPQIAARHIKMRRINLNGSLHFFGFAAGLADRPDEAFGFAIACFEFDLKVGGFGEEFGG